MELTWIHDTCLACDNQTSGGAYCSQSCRLADLKASTAWCTPQTSTQTSPTTPNFSSTNPSASSTGFYLSPAIDWSTYKTQHTTSQLSFFSSTSSPRPNQNDKTLSSSSSRSSLASTNSNGTRQSPFSEEVSEQLRDFANAFDTTRHRRQTWS